MRALKQETSDWLRGFGVGLVLGIVFCILAGCASTPHIPEREPVPLPDLVQWQAPPEAELKQVELQTYACYTLDNAYLLSESLDSAAVLAEQSGLLLDVLDQLDAEAAGLAADRAACITHQAQQKQSHFFEVAMYRLGIAMSWILFLAVAL